MSDRTFTILMLLSGFDAMTPAEERKAARKAADQERRQQQAQARKTK